MSKLSNVTKGKVKKPALVLVYGPDGIGKSSFAADAPGPIFLGPEKGSNNLDVARFPTPENWADVEACLDDLRRETHDYKSVALDSVDWLEPMLHAKICEDYGVKSIELAAGGFGKGYVEATNTWIALTKKLDALRDEKGMNVILIGHSEVVNFNDPQSQVGYDRFQLKLHKKAAAVLREYVEAVLFANLQVYTKKDGTQTRAFGDGARVMFTERRPGWDAKNRLGLPLELPLCWSSFIAACEKGEPESADAILARIDGLVTAITDPDLKGKAVESVTKAARKVVQLQAIENRLKIRVGG